MFKKLFITSFILGGSITLYGQVHKNGLSIKDTITDRELTVPEDIERNFDQLIVDWKKDLSPSLSCNSNSNVNIDYPDSVYIDRLYSLPTEMELVYNPIVRSYIDMYTGRMRGSVEYFLGKSDYYFPIFEQALDKYGLPLELKYLPIIESALNPTIASRMGATGLWQFMIGTGKMYDLEVNSLVDERRDPLKSTEAAAKYLKDLHNIYGDWNLVIAAYNCGPGNVNKAIKRAGGQTDYWAIYPFLPKETRGYVPAFIAAAYVMNYYSDHNICPFEYKYRRSTDTIQVDKQLHLQQVADVLDVSLDELRILNPQYKKDIIPGEFKTYVLNLPSMHATEFEFQKDSIYAYKATEFLAHRKVANPSGYSVALAGTGAKKYKVRRGDNLGSIAKKSGVTVTQIKRWNSLKSNKLRVGQMLAVSAGKATRGTSLTNETQQASKELLTENTPQKISTVSVSDNKASSSNSLSDYFARVQERVTEIDEDSVITVDKEIASLVTDIIDNETSVGNRNRDIQRVQTIYHKVRIGETLTQIATKYNVDRKDISSWNKIKSNVPKVGQRLVIHLPAQKEVLLTENVPTISEESIEEVVSNVKTSVQDDIASKTLVSRSMMNTPTEHTAVVVNEPVTDEKKTEPKPKKKTPNKEIIHIVKKGDTLGHIAKSYGHKLTATDLKRANNLRSDKLSIGQKIKIPR